MTTVTIPSLSALRAQRAAILRLAHQYNADDVRVFGSVARDTATPGSDVDFVVKFRADASLYDLSGLKQALEALLGCRVDVISEHPRMRASLRYEIEVSAVSL